MQVSKVRHYKRRHRLRTLFTRNPVLVLGLDLPFLIVTSLSLRAAAVISLELCMVHMITMLAAFFASRHVDGWVKPLINLTVSTVVMAVSRYWMVAIFRGVTDTLGMYVYLMAVNGMTLVQSQSVTRESKFFPVMGGALLNVAGFTVSMFLLAFFREYFGNGTLWGTPVPAPFKLGGMLVPFFGFILLGFYLAAIKFLNKQLLALSLRSRARKDARFSVVES